MGGAWRSPSGTAGVSDVASPARTCRADVVASYDLGVEAYEKLWSPVILPGAVALWALATGSGVNRLRLGLIDPAARSGVLARLHDALSRLAPEDYRWEGQVICAVAIKPGAGGRRG